MYYTWLNRSVHVFRHGNTKEYPLSHTNLPQTNVTACSVDRSSFPRCKHQKWGKSEAN